MIVFADDTASIIHIRIPKGDIAYRDWTKAAVDLNIIKLMPYHWLIPFVIKTNRTIMKTCLTEYICNKFCIHVRASIAWHCSNALVNWGHLKVCLLLPGLKYSVGYTCMLLKYHVKISRGKKKIVSFHVTFCKKDNLNASLWRLAIRLQRAS